MADDVADFAAFAASLADPDGHPLDLEPWQLDLIAWAMSDNPPPAPAPVVYGRRLHGRRLGTILGLAAGALSGQRMALTAPDRRSREQLLDAALEHVDRYGAVFAVSTAAAREELERMRVEPM